MGYYKTDYKKYVKTECDNWVLGLGGILGQDTSFGWPALPQSKNIKIIVISHHSR